MNPTYLIGLVALAALHGCARSEAPTDAGSATGDEATTALAAAIPDSGLRGAIARAVAPTGSGPGDLRGLTRLSARADKIRDLTGIERLNGLSVLDLADNEVTDIAPLAALRRLVFLDLSENRCATSRPWLGSRGSSC